MTNINLNESASKQGVAQEESFYLETIFILHLKRPKWRKPITHAQVTLKKTGEK
jgi:hypothetical protein